MIIKLFHYLRKIITIKITKLKHFLPHLIFVFTLSNAKSYAYSDKRLKFFNQLTSWLKVLHTQSIKTQQFYLKRNMRHDLEQKEQEPNGFNTVKGKDQEEKQK